MAIASITLHPILIVPVAGRSQRIAMRLAHGQTPFVFMDPQSVPLDRGESMKDVTVLNIPHPIDGVDYNFVCAFLIGAASNRQTPRIQPESVFEGGPSIHIDRESGFWDYTLRAYYVWDFGGRDGHNAVYIDAVNENAFGAADLPADPVAAAALCFLGIDPFVDVAPDDLPRQDGETLDRAANYDGYIDTSVPELPPNTTITITARDFGVSRHFPGWGFQKWIKVPNVAPHGNPIVGTGPNPRELIAHSDDIVVAFACYSPSKTEPYSPVEPILGLVWDTEEGRPVIGPWPGYGPRLWPPPPPPSRFARQLGEHIATLAALADAASRVSSPLQASALELFGKQLSYTSEMVQAEIERLQEK